MGGRDNIRSIKFFFISSFSDLPIFSKDMLELEVSKFILRIDYR